MTRGAAMHPAPPESKTVLDPFIGVVDGGRGVVVVGEGRFFGSGFSFVNFFRVGGPFSGILGPTRLKGPLDLSCPPPPLRCPCL